jgi:hypothetical protein
MSDPELWSWTVTRTTALSDWPSPDRLTLLSLLNHNLHPVTAPLPSDQLSKRLDEGLKSWGRVEPHLAT